MKSPPDSNRRKVKMWCFYLGLFLCLSYETMPWGVILLLVSFALMAMDVA